MPIYTFLLQKTHKKVLIGLFQKKTGGGGGGGGGGVRIWNFQEYGRNCKWNFQGLIKNNVEFPGVIIKKNNVESPGVLGLKILDGFVTQFCGVSRG